MHAGVQFPLKISLKQLPWKCVQMYHDSFFGFYVHSFKKSRCKAKHLRNNERIKQTGRNDCDLG